MSSSHNGSNSRQLRPQAIHIRHSMRSPYTHGKLGQAKTQDPRRRDLHRTNSDSSQGSSSSSESRMSVANLLTPEDTLTSNSLAPQVAEAKQEPHSLSLPMLPVGGPSFLDLPVVAGLHFSYPSEDIANIKSEPIQDGLAGVSSLRTVLAQGDEG